MNDVVSFIDSDGVDYSNTDLHKIKNTAKNDGVRNSIKYTINNEPVVVIEGNILDGVQKSEWVNAAKDVIKIF